MSILKVANVQFNLTGPVRRIEYLGDSIIRIQANAVQVPIGNTNFRPTGEQGLLRYNSETGNFEGHNGSSWGAIAGSGGDTTAVYAHANAAHATANASFARANAGIATANQAFDAANASFARANAGITTANQAFDKANAALVNTSTTLGGTLSTSGITLLGGTFSPDKANLLSQTLSDGATVTWDGSLGQIATVTIAGNRVVANVTNMRVGTYILHVVQDGVGGRLITWANGYRFPANIKPTLSTGAGKRDIITGVSDGTSIYCTYINDV